MVQNKNENELNFIWLDFITRKDLANLEDVAADPRQRPEKEYNHPQDSVMAIIYAIASLKHSQGTEWYWISA